MRLYEKQYFNDLLQRAVERFSERLIQRNAGAENALQRLRADADGEGVWLGEFVTAFFRDALLDNPEGACLVLQALAQRPLPPAAGSRVQESGTIGQALETMAAEAFAALLRAKTEEVLEQTVAFGG